MNKNEFMQRFQLWPLSIPTPRIHQHRTLKDAAVLVPIVVNNNQLSVLLTKRASHLAHHPGQISFPGGKVEAFDENVIATALRETQEEVGLSGDAIDVIGQLHPYDTITGFHITPIVALVQSEQHYQLDHNEVAEIFQVPLSHFLHQQNRITLSLMHHGNNHNVHFIPYQDYNIWGATAAMLQDLSLHLSHN